MSFDVIPEQAGVQQRKRFLDPCVPGEGLSLEERRGASALLS